jgi:RNA polymerase sigma-70 factor (ECF subfamily)
MTADAQALERLRAAGQAAWPAFTLSTEEFAAYVRARWTDAALAEDGERLLSNAADLFLACACARGLPAALDAFEQAHLAQLAGYIARVGCDAQSLDELRQMLRTRLFAPGKMEIEEYTGRGPLGAWVRVVAHGTAIDARRRDLGDARMTEVISDALADGSDPELGYIKAAHREQFREAFRAALGDLPRRSRTVLRLHYLDGLNLEGVAAVCQIGRTSAYRYIVDARETLLAETKRRLREMLELTPSDAESLIQLLRTQLEVSLTRLLRESQG